MVEGPRPIRLADDATNTSALPTTRTSHLPHLRHEAAGLSAVCKPSLASLMLQPSPSPLVCHQRLTGRIGAQRERMNLGTHQSHECLIDQSMTGHSGHSFEPF
jgi:hypothetical protein